MPQPRAARILIAGAGYVGTALAARLLADGVEVHALRRHPASTAGDGEADAIRWHRGDVTEPTTLRDLPGRFDAVVYLVSAGERSETAYRAAYVDGPRHLLEALEPSPDLRFLFVSSTAVYGDAGGAWVAEDSLAEPEGFSGALLLEGERLVLEAAVDSVVVRFAGIYGPGRTRLIERVRRGEAHCLASPDWTNRIHRDDCAGVLRHLLRTDPEHRLYLGVDDEPADRCEVYRWLAARIGAPPPPVDSSASVSPRRARNKRCRNDRLKAEGYRFLYPSFREGYGAILAGP